MNVGGMLLYYQQSSSLACSPGISASCGCHTAQTSTRRLRGEIIDALKHSANNKLTRIYRISAIYASYLLKANITGTARTIAKFYLLSIASGQGIKYFT